MSLYYSKDLCMRYWSIAFNFLCVIVRVAFLEDIIEVRRTIYLKYFYILGSRWKLSIEIFILSVED